MIQPLSLTANSISIDEEIEFNLEDLRIDPDKEIEKPTPILQFKNNNRLIDVFTEGNISMIQGPAKGRKSTLLKLICAAILGGENEIMFSEYHRNRVAIFDTEQSDYHCWRAARVIKFMTRQTIDYFALTNVTTTDGKKKLIEQYLSLNKDCGFIVLDNIVHFVNDFNSATDSSELTAWLMKTKKDFNVHICNVLHENPDAFGSKKARGHLGTNLTNLCETIIRVEKDQHNRSQSIVSPKECRNEEFDEFLITVDGQNTPQAIKRTSEPTVKKSGY